MHAGHLLLFLITGPATTEIYTLSLHDALPIWTLRQSAARDGEEIAVRAGEAQSNDQDWIVSWHPSLTPPEGDRKSTRLNSSHGYISYAVFCLKKKNHGVSCISLPVLQQ